MTSETVGRNEPCPCGSGKKYKRCCGMDAAPKLSAPAVGGAPAMGGGLPPGLENMDPAMMMQLSQAFQRLPRGQMQKFQSLMQRAMAGKDVTREAEELERSLPPEFKEMMGAFAAKMPGDQKAEVGSQKSASAPAAGSQGDMSEDDARRIVEEAVASGKLSREQADALLNPKS